MAASIYIGLAGWSYDDWKGIAYPKPAPRSFDPLAYLAHYFDTIEINSTFYRPATVKIARDWAARVVENDRFLFTAKLLRRFTHEREAAFTRREVNEATAGFAALQDGGKLGALLVQFPWSFRRTDENREWLDDVVRAFQRFPLVLEVRHESWNVPAFSEELTERGIGFVNIDQPLFKRSIKPSARVTAAVGYIRIHGRNYKDWFRKDAGVGARYDYLYTAAELEPWVERAIEITKATRELFVITNNHLKAKGVANALMLKAMTSKAKVPAPPGVVAEYGRQLEPYAYPEEARPRKSCT